MMTPVARSFKESNGTQFWKWTTGFLSTALLAVLGAFYAFSQSAVTKEQLATQIVSVKDEIANIEKEITEIKHDQLTSINNTLISQATELKQVEVDIARIAEKVGTTAHPASH